MTKIPTLAEAQADLHQASDTLVALRKKQADHQPRLETIRDEREKLAFQAHTVGGKAREQLIRLNQEFAQHELTAQDLNVAVRQGEEAIKRAEAMVDAARDYEDAAQMEEAAQEIERLGDELHRSLHETITLYSKFKQAVQRGQQYDYPFTEAAKRAWNTAALLAQLHNMALPFAHRVTFSELGRHRAAATKTSATKARARLLGLLDHKAAA